MKKSEIFKSAAKQLLYNNDKVVFFNTVEGLSFDCYTSGTGVSHDPDYLCEFNRSQYWAWNVRDLASHMKSRCSDALIDQELANGRKFIHIQPL